LDQTPSTFTKPEAQPLAGIPQTLLLQLGAVTWGAAQSLLTVAAQQLPDAVETHVPVGAPGHSLVLAGQEHVPPGPLHDSPLMPRMRVQSVAVQQAELAMQLLLPGQLYVPAAHWQLPPIPEHLEFPSTEVQSLSRQQMAASLVMHVGEPTAGVHTRLPDGQPQVPAMQTSPATVLLQSVSVQQLPIGMQLSVAEHSFVFAGQTHMPLTQLVPARTAQSLSLQQTLFATQVVPPGQTFWPAPQVQAPPAVGQVCPATVQSRSVQQADAPMQELETVQSFCVLLQPQVPPGAGQVAPVTVQSFVVQQALLAMQAAFAVHAFWFVGHEQVPFEQVSPVFGQVLGG
jgi:hypothetical protein